MQELLDECRNAYDEKNFTKLDWLCDKILNRDKNNEIALTYKMYIYCSWSQNHLVFTIADKVHQLYPDNYHAYNCKSRVYLNKKDYENAFKSSECGLKIKDYTELRINRIESLICLNRLDEAYEYSLDSNYNFTEALINCGKYAEISNFKNELSKEELIRCLLKRCDDLDKKSGNNNEEILEICGIILKIDNGNESAL